MGNLMNWIYDTKLGHFLFVFIGGVILGSIIIMIVKGSLMLSYSGIFTCFIISIILSLFDKNKRWY